MNLNDDQLVSYIITNDPTVSYMEDGKFYDIDGKEVTPQMTEDEAITGIEAMYKVKRIHAIEQVFYEGMMTIYKTEVLLSQEGVLGERMLVAAEEAAILAGVLTPCSTNKEKEEILLTLEYARWEKAVKEDLVSRTLADEDVSADLLRWRQRNHSLNEESPSKTNLKKLYAEFGLSNK